MIDPKKTALVCVDLQNYFLLGRPTDAVGLNVVDNLLDAAIPACRKAGIPVLWLSWGLTQEDIDGMPPTIVKGFAADFNFKGSRKTRGLGTDIGKLKLEDGTEIEGGKVRVHEQWNLEFYGPLKEKADSSCDMFASKNRLSEFWGRTKIPSKLGITTLIFSGANTDQCVGGSLQDAMTRGYNCLLLHDAVATTSPDFARQCIEYNTEMGWGLS